MNPTPRSLLVLVFILGCGSIPQEAPSPLRGRLVLETVPNPLIARAVGNDEYELTFDIVMREEGGVGTRIDSFTVDAIALNGIVVRSETRDGSTITDRGYPAEVEAGKYLRFSFTKRWKLPSPLVLAGAAIRVTARTIDLNGVRGVTTFQADVNRFR